MKLKPIWQKIICGGIIALIASALMYFTLTILNRPIGITVMYSDSGSYITEGNDIFYRLHDSGMIREVKLNDFNVYYEWVISTGINESDEEVNCSLLLDGNVFNGKIIVDVENKTSDVASEIQNNMSQDDLDLIKNVVIKVVAKVDKYSHVEIYKMKNGRVMVVFEKSGKGFINSSYSMVQMYEYKDDNLELVNKYKVKEHLNLRSIIFEED